MKGSQILGLVSIAAIGFSIGSSLVTIFVYEAQLSDAENRVADRETRLRIRREVNTVRAPGATTTGTIPVLAVLPNATPQSRGG